MKKNIYYLILAVLFLVSSSFLAMGFPAQLVRKNIAPSALADDDEDEEDEKDEEDEDDDEDEEKSEEKTVTTYVKLPDQIIKRLITETIYDSDGDGVFDPDDSTPNLHNIFLVKDDNFNGVADEYEGK